jgi:hypothetical protein
LGVAAIVLVTGIKEHAMKFDLTAEQQKALLQIGYAVSFCEIIPADVMDQLIGKGLLYKGGPNHVDYTDAGQSASDELIDAIRREQPTGKRYYRPEPAQ